jgi:hypothetical protein
MNPEEAEAKFVDSLERVHLSAAGAIHSLYYFSAFNQRARKDDDDFIKVLITRNANFWGATLYGWQCAYILGIGRTYDNDSDSLRLRDVIDQARDFRGIFGRDRLRKRLMAALPIANSPQKQKIIDGYIHSATGVTDATFAPLYDALDERTHIYNELYRPIRHWYYAHLAADPKRPLSELWEQTTPDEFETLLEFPLQLHAALNHLYTSGQSPLLLPVDPEVRAAAARDLGAIILQQAKLGMT